MIAISFLKSKYSLEETLRKIDNSNGEYIHMDVMDGIYVSNNNLDIFDKLDKFKNISKELDVHLMVNNPIDYIDKLSNLNVKIITFHLDGTDNPVEVINKIKSKNILVGIAINPNEDISILNNYLNLIDYVLIMSVYPGKGGQTFIPSVLDKIKILENKNILIGIDGGINEDTIKYLSNYKIDIIVSGSYVCMSDNYNIQIDNLKRLSKKC